MVIYFVELSIIFFRMLVYLYENELGLLLLLLLLSIITLLVTISNIQKTISTKYNTRDTSCLRRENNRR